MTKRTAIRLGFVGVNTWHLEAFADVILGAGPAAHLGALENVNVTSIWGDPDDQRAEFADRLGAREYSARPEEMIGQVDLAFVIDDDGGGARHRVLAEPFLRAGVATFIDKPMTLELADARRLFELAEKFGTPLLSSSALRFSDELRDAAPELRAIGDVRSIQVHGPGDWYYYGIHAVELLLTMMPSAVAWIHRHASDRQDIAVVGFADGRLATVDILRDAYYVFRATAYGTRGLAQIDVTKNYEYYRAMIQAAIEMATTRRAPVAADQTLEVLKILHAGIMSADEHRTVFLSEVG
jgi:predicted dehydrogenase